MDAITEITPKSYQAFREHRSLCDAVLEIAGLERRNVTHLELVEGTWFVTVNLRNADGKLYCKPGTNEVAKTIVTVDPSAYSTPT